MRKIIAVLAILAATASSLHSQGWLARKSPDKSAIYGELLGKGHLFTLYYERILSPSVGLSVGFSIWPEFLAVPASLNWYFVEGVHSPYAEVGLRFRRMEESFTRKEVSQFDGYRYEYEVWSYEPVTRYNPLLGIGYCYRSGGDGMVFKIGIDAFLGDLGRSTDFVNQRVMGGIGFGFTF